MSTARHHPLAKFRFCPVCGSDGFSENNTKSKRCPVCGFVYYFNPSSAVACFITDGSGKILVARRGKEPAKGSLDLPGGFVDQGETAEQAVRREVMEETGTDLISIRYLFSRPNTYLYSGFEVETTDLFFECRAGSLVGLTAGDDVAELLPMEVDELDPELFGLPSVKSAVERYKEMHSEGGK